MNWASQFNDSLIKKAGPNSKNKSSTSCSIFTGSAIRGENAC